MSAPFAPAMEDGGAAVKLATPEQKHAVVQLLNVHRENARHCPKAFCEYVLRHTKTNQRMKLTPVQEEGHDLITANKFTMILSHPNSGKTTQYTIGRTLFELGTNPASVCVILSSTDKGATRLLLDIREYIERSEALHEVFPHLRPADGKPWAAHWLFVQRDTFAPDPSVQSFGIGGKPIGLRIDRLICDDILCNDNASSQIEQDAIDTKIWSADVYGRLVPRTGKWWVVGNAFGVNDVYQRIAKRKNWCCARYPVMDEHTGEIFFPQQWSREAIEEARASMHPLEFSRQMLCLPVSDASSRFKREWIQLCMEKGNFAPSPNHLYELNTVYELAHVPMGCRVIVGVDLATGRHRDIGDRTAIVVILVDPAEHKRILMVESGRWQIDEIVDRLVDVNRRYNPAMVLVENNGSQEFVLQVTRKVSNVPVMPYTTSSKTFKDPFFGIDAMANEFRNGYWTIPNVDGKMDSEIRELIAGLRAYNPSEHCPDRVMALFFCFEGARITRPKGRVGRLDLTSR